jgi:mannitol/fructose-specific phosphotransferase system IIA component (Ntr-type)
MERLPTRNYICPEGSSAEEVLEKLGVLLAENEEGERQVQLDPILMVAILALQMKDYPLVSQLIDKWRDEDLLEEIEQLEKEQEEKE